MKSSFVLSSLLACGLSASAQDAVTVKVHSLKGPAPILDGKTLEKGRTLKARDILRTGEGSTVELMVHMGATEGPGTLVRVTPNSQLTVLNLTVVTMDDEPRMDFEVAAIKVSESAVGIAAVIKD
jgi:hypothetical protein